MALDFNLDFCGDHRPGGRIGFHGRVVFRAVRGLHWTGVVARRRLAFSGGFWRLCKRNRWNRQRHRNCDEHDSQSSCEQLDHPAFPFHKSLMFTPISSVHSLTSFKGLPHETENSCAKSPPNSRPWLATALSPALSCFCPVGVYPSLTSGTGRQGVRIEFSFELMDTSRPGFRVLPDRLDARSPHWLHPGEQLRPEPGTPVIVAGGDAGGRGQ